MHIQFKSSMYILVVLFCFTFVGCKTLHQQETNSSLGSQVVASESFFHLNSDQQSSKDLEDFLERYKNGKYSEQAKIDYLLNAVKKSDLTFVRNGSSYSSGEAAKWLRWKMHHPQYSDNPIDSADEFVHRVANGSAQSGLPYQLILANGDYVNADLVLANELKTLEKGLSRYAATEFSTVV